MMKKFTEEEMLAYWKRRLGLAATPGVSVEADGNCLDRRLLDSIRAWYADLLLTAPRPLLPYEEMKEEAAGGYVNDNCVELLFPDRGARFVALKLKAWDEAVDFTYGRTSARAAMQRDPLTRATPDAPVIVEGDRRLFVHGLPSGLDPEEASAVAERTSPVHRPLPEIDYLIMVAAPADGSYMLDESLLRDLPVRPGAGRGRI